MTTTQSTSRKGPISGRLGLLLATLIGAFIFAAPVEAQGPGAPAPRSFKVGIVDLGEAFNKYDRKAKLEEEINTLKKEFDEEMKRQEKLIKELDKELEDMDASSPEYWQLRDRIKLELQKRQIMKERMELVLRQKLVDMTLLILEDINGVIKEYGKQFQYTFIVKVDNQGFGREEFREKIFRAQVQSILYYDEGIDITKPILLKLNQDFAAGKFKKPEAESRPKPAATPGGAAKPPSGAAGDNKQPAAPEPKGPDKPKKD